MGGEEIVHAKYNIVESVDLEWGKRSPFGVRFE